MATERSKLVPKGPMLAYKGPMLTYKGSKLASKEPRLTFSAGPHICFFGEKACHSEALASSQPLRNLSLASHRIQCQCASI